MGVPDAAAAHYRQMQRLQVLALAAGRRSWGRVDERFLSETWTRALADLTPVVAAVQVRAAEAGASYGAATLAEQGVWVAPEVFVDPAAFGGFAADGRSLDGLLYSPITTAKDLIGGGMGAAQALMQARGTLETMLRTTVADAGRQAASVDVAARPHVGYVRMLNPPSCPRCVVMAGKFFRWNTGFLRHPRCDCVHIMTTAGSLQGAKDEGLVSDPYDYFNGLSKAEQNRLWGANSAQAVRDGADIFQVTNARRGAHGMFTTEGMGRRGYARQGLGPRQRRMTPDAIYRQAEGQPNPREFALDLLKTHSYTLPGGQNPLGSIVGQREGFGALGRGGTRRAASQAVLDARATGVRDGSRYTMTEAERRLYDAEQRWRMVQQGRNPYSSPGFGSTPDPFGQRLNTVGAGNAPLTPKIAAQVEDDYRRWLTTGGQKFVPSGFEAPRVASTAAIRSAEDITAKAALDRNVSNLRSFYGDNLHVAGDTAIEQAHIADLAKFNSSDSRALADYYAGHPGGGIYVGNTSAPNLDDMGFLRGAQPRGWPDGSTWDTVPGCHSPSTRVTILGGGEGHGHGGISLALHEGSHALDDAYALRYGARVADAPNWVAGVERMDDSLRLSPYFSRRGNPEGYASEVFAEAHASYSMRSAAGEVGEDLAVGISRDLGGFAPRESMAHYGQWIVDNFRALELP